MHGDVARRPVARGACPFERGGPRLAPSRKSCVSRMKSSASTRQPPSIVSATWSASRCSACSVVAARSWGSPAASTARWSPRCASARSARSASSALLHARARLVRATRYVSATRSPSRLGIDDGRRGHRAALEAVGCYAPPDAGDPDGLPRLRRRAGRCKITPALDSRRAIGSTSSSSPCRARRASSCSSRMPAARVPPARRGDQLQAARPQDDRVLPRRPARLRRRRHAEPPRVRPGLLRQAGRRRGRREADRAPLQDAGLRARRRTSASPRRSGAGRRRPTRTRWSRRRRSSTSRCPTTAWTSASGRTTTACQPAEVGAGRGASRRSRSSASTRTSRPSGARRATCTRRRCSSSPSESV